MFKDAAFPLILAVAPLLASTHYSTGGPRDASISVDNSRVLDGDTIVWRERVFKIAGIDAPELGPWAKCWAEAALAGHAKTYLETELSSGAWQLMEEADKPGRMKLARVIRSDNEDLADLMVVRGFAADTPGRWNWCGENANLHAASEEEPSPRGPSLWWPSGKMYDRRAAD